MPTNPSWHSCFSKGGVRPFTGSIPPLFRLEDFAEQTRGEQIWVAEKGQPLRIRLHLGLKAASCITSTWWPTGTGRAWGVPCWRQGWPDAPATGLPQRWPPATPRRWPSTTAWAGRNTDETGHCDITGALARGSFWSQAQHGEPITETKGWGVNHYRAEAILGCSCTTQSMSATGGSGADHVKTSMDTGSCLAGDN